MNFFINDDCERLNGQGYSFCILGKYGDAIRCFDEALGIDPDHIHALNGKGNAFHELGKYGDAIQCYERALEIDPDFMALYSCAK